MAKLEYDETGRLLFTQEMRKEYTILIPQMLPIHFGFFAKLLARSGYNVAILNNDGKAVVDSGLKYVHNDACYPAIASYELMLPMIESAQARSLRYHVGITRSNDAIYCGQGRPVMGYLPNEGVVEHWVNAGVLNVERETAAILTLAQLFHARGGSICTVCNSSITQKVGVSQGIDDAIAVGLEGLALLARRDAEKERAGQKWWSPHCG